MDERKMGSVSENITGRKRSLEGKDNLSSAKKRLKVEVNSCSASSHPESEEKDKIYTPFNEMTGFDDNILNIIDGFMPLNQKLRNSHCHWFVSLGLSKDYNTAFLNASALGEIKAVRLLYADHSDKITDNCLRNAFLQNPHLDVVQFVSTRVLIQQEQCGNNFLWASSHGYVELVKQMVLMGANLFFYIGKAFSLAAMNGHLPVIKYLLSQCSSVEAKQIMVNAENDLAFRYASQNGDLEMVKYLIYQGANIHAGNNFAIAHSVKTGNLEMVKFLVRQGADATAWNHSTFPWPCRREHLDLIRYLIDHGADVAFNDNYAIRSAAAFGDLELVKYLVSKGADIHAYEQLAFLNASSYGHFHVLKYLLELADDEELNARFRVYRIHMDCL